MSSLYQTIKGTVQTIGNDEAETEKKLKAIQRLGELGFSINVRVEEKEDKNKEEDNEEDANEEEDNEEEDNKKLKT